MPRAREVTLEDGTAIMMKICIKCKEDKTVDCYSLHKRAIDKCQSCCRTCYVESAAMRRSTINQSNDWAGYVKGRHQTAAAKARMKGLAICSLEEWVDIFWEQFAATNGCCPELGIEYSLTNDLGGSCNPKAPSPDQIVPSTGYVRGNIRWVCGFFNNLKSDYSLDTIDILLEAYMYRRGVIEEGEIPLPEKPIYHPPT